ncbi:MAG: HAD hydrolase family protein [Bacteroidota bacterium]
MEKSYNEYLNHITTFIFDVDGVLADHSIFVFTNGQIVRQLHQKELVALEKAVSQKFIVGVITGGSLGGLLTTFHNLGIRDIYEKKRDKKAAYDDFKLMYDLDDEQILYMGDDLPDYAVMRIVGLPTCPQNAAPEVKEISIYTSPYSGGQGCVRDVIEKVMKLQKVWHP